ncbi:caspase, EACC1-associated type [Actinoplanes sp. CA-030573]|uniref:caspase, EACC1-associated type n=1 Tax=Actinoplanes sp. CA-030573 TaxID=3239898 RepID=UPI003D924FA4
MRRALIIATEKYEDPQYRPLPGTQADADNLERVLADAAIGGFEVTVLRNENLRKVAVDVEQFFKKAPPDATLLLYLSGHGEVDDDGHLYFINHDTDHDSLHATALAAHHVAKEMRHSRARAKIVLLDCCYGGAFGRADGSRGRFRGKTADIEALEGRGRVVMTAATAVQRSYEDRSGVFTDAVVEGLEHGWADLDGDGFVDTGELFEYVQRRMAGARQTPTYSADIVYGPIHIARNPGHPEPAPFPPLRRRSVLAFSRPRKFLRELGGRGRLPRPVVGGMLAGATLLAGCATQADGPVATRLCPATTQLRIAVDPADLAAYRGVAGEFERYVAARSHGCRSVHPYLFAADAAQVTAGLAGGWGAAARHVPHPDVWFPAAGRDVPAGAAGPIERVVPVARTPIVLGVTAPQAGEDDAFRRARATWPQLFATGSARWGVIRGDPTLSTTAQMVTGQLYARRSPAEAHDEVERAVEQRLDAGRYPLTGEPGLLCRQLEIHRTSPSAKTPAVILTEQELVRFNLGLPDGDCVPGEKPGNADHLVAYYPAQTPVVTKVAVQLRWPAGIQSDETHAYARWLVRWLAGDDGRAALHRQGLRTSSLDAGQPLVRDNGALPDWPFGALTGAEATSGEARATAAVYAKARRSGRFLVALDASGSMNTVTGDPTETRYEVAVAALRQAAARVGGADELGVVTFSGPGATPPRPVLGFTRPAAGLTTKVGRLAAAVRPGGDTPLYQAVIAGAGQLRSHPGGPGQLRALVVLTDGRDTSRRPPPTPAQVAGVRVFVIAVGDVTCADNALEALAATSGGGCFDAGLDALEDVLSGMFRALWNR